MELRTLHTLLLVFAGCSCQLLGNSSRNTFNSPTAFNEIKKDFQAPVYLNSTGLASALSNGNITGTNKISDSLEEFNLKNKTSSSKLSLVALGPPISVKVLHGEEGAISISDTVTKKRLPEILKRDNLNVYSIDYVYNETLVFFAAYGKIFRATLEGRSAISNPVVIVAHEVEGPVRLAVDWVHSRLYWMADKYQTVMSADLHGKNRKLLFDSIKNFSFPNNIVVDPYERMIFFVSNYAIYTSDLSGENVTMVLLEGNYPGEVGRGVRCVALDRANRKLYFSGRNFEEADTMFYLARANYDGSEVEDFNTTGVGDVYSMEVLGDTLYFAQHTEEVCHDEVLSVKTTSREKFTPRKIFVPSLCKSNMWGIKVLHPCVQRHPNDKYCSDFYI